MKIAIFLNISIRIVIFHCLLLRYHLFSAITSSEKKKQPILLFTDRAYTFCFSTYVHLYMQWENAFTSICVHPFSKLLYWNHIVICLLQFFFSKCSSLSRLRFHIVRWLGSCAGLLIRQLNTLHRDAVWLTQQSSFWLSDG